jgi:asparagine synthase (glutamine-hydrolysing)
VSKYLLKRHLDGRVPRSVVHRPKQGFTIPLAAWLRKELRPLGEDLLLSPRALGRGYLKPAAVRGYWDEHQRGIRNNSARLWTLMSLELWHRTFLDRSAVDGPLAA